MVGREQRRSTRPRSLQSRLPNCCTPEWAQSAAEPWQRDVSGRGRVFPSPAAFRARPRSHNSRKLGFLCDFLRRFISTAGISAQKGNTASARPGVFEFATETFRCGSGADGRGRCRVMGHTPQPCRKSRRDLVEGSKAASVVGRVWLALLTRQSRLSHLRIHVSLDPCLEFARALPTTSLRQVLPRGSYVQLPGGYGVFRQWKVPRTST